MRYFSMFSGIGGFELGIQRAFDNRYETPQEQSDTGIQRGSTNDTVVNVQGATTCVGYSEIDKYADATYKSHFGGHTNYGDATKINARELPDFDLLVGGFPCQAFSVAGKRAGFDDTRGTLFFDIARILAEKRPRHLVLENVKGLLSHDNGKTFETIIGVLTDLGYFVEWQVLNSKDFGVPQNRERVFIVGHLGGEPRRKVFPITGDDRQDTKPSDDPTVGQDIRIQRYKPNSEHESRGETHATRQPLRFLNRNQKNIEGDYAYTVDASQTSGVKIANTIDSNYYKGINTNPGHASSTRGYQIGQRIRRLTPLECERLQGFPDNWTVGSDTQRYKQCGNAVTVNVVEAVISSLIGEQ